MTKTLSAKRFLLGVSTIAEETADPNAGAGTAGQAGSLWVRQGDAATTPTQTYLNLTGDATNWQLQNLVNLNVFNVTFFGAVGDGATDDTAAINAAIGAATASGVGGIIYFPPGVYRVTRPVTGIGSIQLSNVHDLVFMGDGFASQIAMIGSSLLGDWYMFRIRNGTSRIKFINLSFDSNITEKDPAEQNHFFNISGVAGDPQGGPHDIDIVGCYIRFIFGDGIRALGEPGQVARNINCLYNDFAMTASRACVVAQRSTDAVNVSFCYCSGSQDQQVDFEPTAGDGPVNWTIIGNHLDHSASLAASVATVSGTGNADVDQADRRLLFAFNTVTNGGAVTGTKGLVSADLVGNIITVNQTVVSASAAPIDIIHRVQDCNIIGNICINETATNNRLGIRIASNVSLAAPAEHDLIADNLVTVMGSNCQGIVVTDTTDVVVSGNFVQVDTSVASVSAAISAVSATLVVDQITAVGNMIIGITNQMKAAFNYACSGFDIRNVVANHNYVRRSLAIVFFARTLAEQFLDWRAIQGNNGVSISGAPIQGPATLEGVTLEGNAGPGAQITLVQTALGPETRVTAPVGSVALNTSGGQGTVLWMKETGTGVSGGKTGWVQQGSDELSFGVLDTGTGTAARFVAPGGGQAAVSTTEIKWAVPRAGTIRNCRLTCVAGTGAATVTYSLRKNGVAAANISAANTATSGTSANTTAVVAGDLISLQITRTAIVAAGQTNAVFSYELTT